MKHPLLLALALLPLLAGAQVQGPFEGIEIAGAAAVQFTQGAQDQVVVEGDEDAQRAVELEVRNGLLVIRPAGNWKFWNSRRLQLLVTARELKRVTISGAADFVAASPVQAGKLAITISGAGLARFDQLKADQLTFTVSGAGDGQFAGRTRTLAINVSGKSEFRGEQLHAESAQVRVSGIGNVKTWVTGDLNVSVSGIGTVDYWGSPQVQRQASGISRVNDHGAKPAP